jgi:hypothetical protein
MAGEHKHLHGVRRIIYGDRTMAMRILIRAQGPREQMLQSFPFGLRVAYSSLWSSINVEGLSSQWHSNILRLKPRRLSRGDFNSLESFKNGAGIISSMEVYQALVDYRRMKEFFREK